MEFGGISSPVTSGRPGFCVGRAIAATFAGSHLMLDALLLTAAVIFFALSIAYVHACERL